jgi:hypothetical protein
MTVLSHDHTIINPGKSQTFQKAHKLIFLNVANIQLSSIYSCLWGVAVAINSRGRLINPRRRLLLASHAGSNFAYFPAIGENVLNCYETPRSKLLDRFNA